MTSSPSVPKIAVGDVEVAEIEAVVARADFLEHRPAGRFSQPRQVVEGSHVYHASA
jgi:hypothetical protein